jgi:hypothetical protein
LKPQKFPVIFFFDALSGMLIASKGPDDYIGVGKTLASLHTIFCCAKNREVLPL